MRFFLILIIFLQIHFAQAQRHFDFEITKKNQQNFLHGSFRWRVSFGQKKRYYIKGYKKDKKVRLDVFSSQLSKRIYSLIIKDSLWYVVDINKNKRIYRPYEAPTRLVNFYSYILRSRPQFFQERHLNFLGKAHIGADEIIFQKQLTKAMKSSFEGVSYDKYLKNYLKVGIIHKVDKKNYLLTYFGHYKQEIYFEDFFWQDLEEQIFAIEGDWQDYSQPIKNWQDWVILSYQPYFNALQDNRLVNIKNLQVRRFPIKGLNASAATFSNDKRYAYIAVGNVNYNYDTLTKMDLSNQQTKSIKLLQKIKVKELKVSPNNQKLAVIYTPLNSRQNFSKTHLMVIDLLTSKPIFVSKPMQCHFLNWQDDNTLIFQNDIQEETFFLPTITSFDLRQNKYTKIAVGHNPFWYKDDLYFINLDKKQWCRLNFKTEKKEYIGFKKYARPQPLLNDSWLMIDYSNKKPKLVIFNLESGLKKELPLLGLWQ